MLALAHQTVHLKIKYLAVSRADQKQRRPAGTGDAQRFLNRKSKKRQRVVFNFTAFGTAQRKCGGCRNKHFTVPPQRILHQ